MTVPIVPFQLIVVDLIGRVVFLPCSCIVPLIYSYPFHIFKQIQAVMSVANRVYFRIFTDGLLYVQAIIGEDLESIFYELKVSCRIEVLQLFLFSLLGGRTGL